MTIDPHCTPWKNNQAFDSTPLLLVKNQTLIVDFSN